MEPSAGLIKMFLYCNISLFKLHLQFLFFQIGFRQQFHKPNNIKFSSLKFLRFATRVYHMCFYKKKKRKEKRKPHTKQLLIQQLQMLLFPNALCCSLYECNCVCAVTKIFTKFLPANNFCQLLRVTRKRSCTSAGNAQAQLHFQDDQQTTEGV